MTEATDTSTTLTTVGGRATAVKNLKVLKTPEEGGTKKEYEDFVEKINNRVMVHCSFGSDIGHVIKNLKDPKMIEPLDLSIEDEKSKLRVHLWNAKVDRYAAHQMALEENKIALYALISDALSKIMKGRLRGKEGFQSADEDADVLWLLNSLDEIMVRFEEIKPKLLSIDDQMERIMKLKQDTVMTNEDFLKTVMK